MGANREALQRYSLAVVSHLLLVAAWYLFVELGKVPKFVMPSPQATLERAARPELPLAREHRRHRRRDLRRLLRWRWSSASARAAVLLVAALEIAGHAAAGQPQHDPEGGARAADHRLVQVRHRAEHHDGVRDLLLPDRADHGARAARGRAGTARPGAHAERLALAALHQDPAAGRAALHLLRHEGRGDPRGRRRHRRRVPRLRPRARLPDAAGAGDARHRRDVHGGDPDHAARHAALRIVLGLERLLVVQDARLG